MPMMITRDIGSNAAESRGTYSVTNEAARSVERLLACCRHQLPKDILQNPCRIFFTSSPAGDDLPIFPCPLRELEAASAIIALESMVVSALADLRYGLRHKKVHVDVPRVGCYLMSAYITTIDGLDKSHPKTRHRMPGTSRQAAAPFLFILLGTRIGNDLI